MCEVEHVAAQQRGQEHGMGTFVVLDGPQGAVLVTPTAPQEAENDGVSIRYLYTGKEISFLPNDRPGVTGKTTHARASARSRPTGAVWLLGGQVCARR